jgi:hypothetical protein
VCPEINFSLCKTRYNCIPQRAVEKLSGAAAAASGRVFCRIVSARAGAGAAKSSAENNTLCTSLKV